MKRIIAFASLLLLLTQGAALANPDYSEINQAFTNFFASLDEITKALPAVDTATGAVQVIDTLSLATEKVCVAGERFATNYPEICSQPEPPPEFAAAFGKIKRLKTDYAAVPAGLDKLATQFGAVPEVQVAFVRLKKSFDRLSSLGRPPKK